MKKTLLIMGLLLFAVVLVMGQGSPGKHVLKAEYSISWMTLDSATQVVYAGPFDVSGFWNPNNLGLTGDGNQDSQKVWSPTFYCLATDTGAGVPKFTVTRHLWPIRPTVTKTGFKLPNGSTNYNDVVGPDSLALFSTVVSKDSTLTKLDRVESSIAGTKVWLTYKIVPASGHSRGTTVYLGARGTSYVVEETLKFKQVN